MKRLLFVLFLITVPNICMAETSIHTYGITSGSGYEAGAGISVEHLHNFNDKIAISISGDYAKQKKQNAIKGYTYNIRLHGRYYLTKEFFLKGGYAYSGYSSKFETTTWEKSALWPYVGAGVVFDRFKISLSYYPPEKQTVNKVQAVKSNVDVRVYGGWFLSGGLNHMEFRQSGKSMTDTLYSVGLKYCF